MQIFDDLDQLSEDKLRQQYELLRQKFFALFNTTTRNRSTSNENNGRVQIFAIREGIANQLNANQYRLIASITLVRDDGLNILIDTGLATDTDGRELMLKSWYNFMSKSVFYL